MRIQFEPIDRDSTPLGVLTLHRYHAESGEVGYEVRLDDHFLMASHGQLGEVAMAQLARDRLVSDRSEISVLVGGLGAGHTLRAVLELQGVSRVVVVEIGRKVVEWNRRYFAEVNHGALDDPRVAVEVGDLRVHLAAQQSAYDLLLIDVDNGPGWLASAGNAALYERPGLRSCRQALRPSGVLAVWSPERNRRLEVELAALFGNLDTTLPRALDPRPVRPGEAVVGDVVYLARNPAQNPAQQMDGCRHSR